MSILDTINNIATGAIDEVNGSKPRPTRGPIDIVKSVVGGVADEVQQQAAKEARNRQRQAAQVQAAERAKQVQQQTQQQAARQQAAQSTVAPQAPVDDRADLKFAALQLLSGAEDDVSRAGFERDQGIAQNNFQYQNAMRTLGFDPKTREVDSAEKNPYSAYQLGSQNAREAGADLGQGTGGRMFELRTGQQRSELATQASNAFNQNKIANSGLKGRYDLAKTLSDSKAARFGGDNALKLLFPGEYQG